MIAEHLLEGEILFGAAYYPEYFPAERIETDLDLIAVAGMTVIRLGESVWSTWEPRDGVFETAWLRPVLEAAAARGIRVVLGTPTYAVPPWLQRAHPEIAAESATGRRVPWGGAGRHRLRCTSAPGRWRCCSAGDETTTAPDRAQTSIGRRRPDAACGVSP
ncbi:beta-galactosidase [Ruania alba]|uniref:Beta-galactosidase n=1 Tax=Ruania alba TaxID=648782 RepID=A0A1H5L0V4_9MICO|nr:beta-galactosidase [Ruania alba]SEE69828.1 Beta-galactosidase [Ruania alba]